MIKILHLNNYLPYTSGVTRCIYQIVKNTKDIFEHEVICFGGDAKSMFEELQIKFKVKKYSGVYSIPSLYNFLRNYCTKNKIDIVHNHHRFFDTITSIVPRRKFKTVTTVHSKVFDWKVLSYKADRLISVSNAITKHLIEHYSKLNEKIFTFNNFVDPGDIKVTHSNNDLRKQLELADRWVIVFIGRFSKEKGTDILLKAFEKFYRIRNEAALVLIGEGEEENWINKFCKKSKLPITIINPVRNIFDYYNIADIIVLPSRVDPFPFVMLETGLMRKPFIGSNVDGIQELIKHKVNGILFNSENVDELISSFRLILEDKLLAQNISDHLYEQVIENYTTATVIPEYVKFYNSL